MKSGAKRRFSVLALVESCFGFSSRETSRQTGVGVLGSLGAGGTPAQSKPKATPAQTDEAPVPKFLSEESTNSLALSARIRASISVEENREPSLSDATEILGAELTKIDRLVDGLQMYEAGLILRSIDTAVTHLPLMSALASDKLSIILQRLNSDPMLISLRDFLVRYERALEDIAVPSQRTDVSWSEYEATDPTISEDYFNSFKVRYKSADEYDPEGPYAQFFVRAEMHNVPLSVSQRVAVEREVELVANTAHTSITYDLLEGDTRGRESLFRASLHAISHGGINPWTTDNFEVRELTALQDAPLPGLRPGMLCMVASTPPQELTRKFGGFDVPACTSGCKRISGMTILRFVEPEVKPGRCRITVMAQGGVNIPSFLLPVSLVKRIFAHNIGKSMRHMAVSVAPNWTDSLYAIRMEQQPALYHPLAAYDSRETLPERVNLTTFLAGQKVETSHGLDSNSASMTHTTTHQTWENKNRF